MSASTSLPSWNDYGFFGGSPAGATASNPLISNPAGSSNNPLISNPAGGTGSAPAIGSQPYNISPGTQSGSGVFGSVPGAIGMPNPYQDISQVVPSLPQDNSAISTNILAELQGGLSPGTMDAIGQAQDAFGIGGPVNTSPLSMGTTDTALESQGLGQYNAAVPTIASTQTVSPALQEQIAEYNDVMGAAPNPTEAGLVDIGAGLAGSAAQKAEGC